jgi:hypothetical protein
MIPWESNQFAFVNWFWSGVYAARQFTRGLRPWQSEGLRWCTVEVLGRDLWVDGMERIGGAVGGTSTGAAGGKDGKGVGEWRELCGFWRGVWGLRLRVKGSVVSERKDEIEVSAQRGWNGEDGAWSADEAEKKDGQKEESILDVEGVWVSDGLARMKSVRWIELEIEDEAVERDVKLTFCAQLEEKLTAWRSQENGWEGKVQVIFVEKVKIPPVPNKNFVWYGGEPGDESIWGLDM